MRSVESLDGHKVLENAFYLQNIDPQKLLKEQSRTGTDADFIHGAGEQVNFDESSLERGSVNGKRVITFEDQRSTSQANQKLASQVGPDPTKNFAAAFSESKHGIDFLPSQNSRTDDQQKSLESLPSLTDEKFKALRIVKIVPRREEELIEQIKKQQQIE